MGELFWLTDAQMVRLSLQGGAPPPNRWHRADLRPLPEARSGSSSGRVMRASSTFSTTTGNRACCSATWPRAVAAARSRRNSTVREHPPACAIYQRRTGTTGRHILLHAIAAPIF
ncbi:hypothetical protein [Paracoccus aminovorans]|uniref:hypothetical protein n=1 Tax=Paracoccus aminovorans TaxID=34004 RepID=UPI0011AE9CB9|nr:hypothetical protein [Paracoccus aminovorans]